MLRVGIIGCGGIGKHHAQRLATIPDTKITAVCDIIPARAEKLAGRTESQPFTDYKEMYDLVDVIWVCTPPHTHHDITMDSLKAGKHTFCEKPMALSKADAQEMMECSRSVGKLLAVGYCLRFWPWTIKCKEIVDSGLIGDLTTIWVTRMSPIPGTDWIPFEEKSGGMLTEQTTHNLDWMRYIAGDVESVYALCQTVTPGATIKDNASAVIKFKNGATGQVMASWSSATDWLESGIVGTKGVIRTGQGGEIKVWVNGKEMETIQPDNNDMYLEEEKYFLNCVREGKPYLFSLEEAIKSLEVSLAIHESAETRKVVEMN